MIKTKDPWRVLARTWADERLDEVALDIHRLLPSRIVSAVLVALLLARPLGAATAVAWLALLLAAEGLAWMVTRRFSPDTGGAPDRRAAFVLMAIPINLIWAGLGAMLWLSPMSELKMAAIGVWVGQVIFAQNYRHQPWVLIVVSVFAPLISLLVFPLLFYPAQGLGPDTVRLGLIMVVVTSVTMMTSNRVAARRMDELTRRLREERERALEATRAKSTFIAVTSHELRTPMNGLLGMAHALSRSALNDAQREQVRLMIKSGDNLMQLLNDVLDLSRIEAGKVELTLEAFKFRDMVNDVIDTWRDAAEAKDLELSVCFAPEVPVWIEGDALRVRQVLTNLIANALKFAVEGGVYLNITAPEAEKDGLREIQVDVRDTGPGVPPEAVDRVFESFTQADDTVSRRHGGAGLGLSIARALARQMGGDLILAPSDRGARFIFSLRAPVVSAPPVAAREPEPADEAPLSAIRVLMAEDNAINQLVVKAMLETTGLSLTVVDNGKAALEALAERAFDCVLMDINMPVMDGITALKAIRTGATGDAALPVIALTASAMAGDRERFLELGFDEHLGKPVNPAALITAILQTVRADALHDAA